MRKYDAKRKEKNLRKKALSPLENAQKLKAQHDKEMKSKKNYLGSASYSTKVLD